MRNCRLKEAQKVRAVRPVVHDRSQDRSPPSPPASPPPDWCPAQHPAQHPAQSVNRDQSQEDEHEHEGEQGLGWECGWERAHAAGPQQHWICAECRGDPRDGEDATEGGVGCALEGAQGWVLAWVRVLLVVCVWRASGEGGVEQHTHPSMRSSGQPRVGGRGSMCDDSMCDDVRAGVGMGVGVVVGVCGAGIRSMVGLATTSVVIFSAGCRHCCGGGSFCLS